MKRHKWIYGLMLEFVQLGAWASGVTPLPVSFGALMYDMHYASDPTSHATIQPGHWTTQLQAFNNGAKPANLITRLYPYSSDIEITSCTASNLNACQIDPGYASGNASVTSYRATFPNATIMPIVDIAFKYADNILLKTNTALADMVASALATQLCNDPNVNGVFFDLETANSLSYPGLMEFYTQMSILLASGSCVDNAHPKGRYMAIYLTPVGDDWTSLATIFSKRNNGFVAIPLYDVTGFKSPPTPDPLSAYNAYVTPALTNAKTNANSTQVPYTIIVPAGASFGTFQSYGVYTNNPTLDYNYNYQVVKDFSSLNTSQLGFVQAARNAACSNNNAYFMGMDYWSWQEYINDSDTDPSYPLRGPNLPDPTTVTFLENSASCF
jgi:hypothetical protein